MCMCTLAHKQELLQDTLGRGNSFFAILVPAIKMTPTLIKYI